MKMTPEQLDAIQSLREKGCAVIIWTHEELRGVKATRVEAESISHGYAVIEDLVFEPKE